MHGKEAEEEEEEEKKRVCMCTRKAEGKKKNALSHNINVRQPF